MSARSAFQIARYLAVGLALGVVSVLLPADIPVALAVTGALTLPVVAWLALGAPRDEAETLLPIFIGAVALRVGLGILIAYAVSPDFFSLDHGRYQLVGRELAEHWAGLRGRPELLTTEAGYYVWNAFIYTLVGFVPLAATLSNAALAGLCVILAYRIARGIAGREAARFAALFAAFFPSLVLWSSLNLKDTCTILCILAALRGAQRLQSGLAPGAIAMLLAGLFGLAQLRDYLTAIVVLSAGLAVLLPRLQTGVARFGFASAVAIIALIGVVPEPVEEFSEESSFAALDQHRRNLAIGNSAYHGDADVSTPVSAARFLPVGIAYFMLAPAPWQLWNARQWITLPEMLVWYALLPWVFLGMRYAWRTRNGAALAPACFALLTTLSYALVSSNLGTAYRHRAQVLIFYLIFAGVGLAQRQLARREATEVPTLTPVAAT